MDSITAQQIEIAYNDTLIVMRPVYVTYELFRDKRREQGTVQGTLQAKEQKEAVAT